VTLFNVIAQEIFLSIQTGVMSMLKAQYALRVSREEMLTVQIITATALNS